MPENMGATTQHVPAWKRLGLKLKQASDVTSESDSPKRKREADGKDHAQVKKSKKSESALGTPAPAVPQPTQSTKAKKEKKSKRSSATDVSTTTLEAGSTTQQPSAKVPNLSRQKSVTFTPETKLEDGDSIKQLFTAWVAEQKAKDPAFVLSESQQAAFDTPEPPKVEETVNADLDDKEQRVARVKKEKKEKKPKGVKKQAFTKTEFDPALAYLDQFCNSKDTWKFQKIHQINLLKNVYNEKLIPSSYIEKFYVYIKDLKGHARTLLRDSALAVKVKDIEAGDQGFIKKMDDPDQKQLEYLAALKEYLATMLAAADHPETGYEDAVLSALSDYSMRSRMVKRMRAERILAELALDGEVAKHADVDEGDEKPAKASNGKVVRRRKQRTAIEISDSSSSDSSDSESEEEPAQKTPKKQVASARVQKNEDTSDTSSAASSSDSDSSDESS